MARKSGIQLGMAAVHKVGKTTQAKAAKPRSSTKIAGTPKLRPRHPQNPFRQGSAYGVCFDLLAQANPDGLQREKLVELLAAATGKSAKRAAFDAQVCLSARGAAGPDLNPFEGPRNRSCRFGFWVKRENSHVKLVLPAAGAASKEMP